MTLTYTFDPVVDPALRDGIAQLWTEVTNAGGAVGFVPPVTVEDIRPALVRHLVAMAEGRHRLLVGRDAEGAVQAAAFLAFEAHPLRKHWVWAYTVMVGPALQGRGAGRELMAALADAARSLEGIEAIRLECRGGVGLEHFYAACGYKEVGRVPDAIRVAPGDDRDDITMLLPLR
ncbi:MULTISPECIES: GNAT family N-acetyltransferase [Streptomyces]|uniref:GNAT family N-acetyltransferase n=1 Tax=Streptomyces katrae TaxID=68223 RepID=A0ABT7H1K8_9ACTN|nr:MULTISPECIES: GNAT family N-acetyltransferase [Streptomyces]MDK9499401.1 GNAT family N-acetyltransferase [Streptomyces katrae]RST01662.1 GNAT family N-acetyltransferase [Streptomyces sp. WAC07149]GLX21111.1 N-acetyltransferase [Streptomyces lavendulae subsp. lavendulae]GLX25605.1 N-acetyltransferase [Streptomyces lavendulae subsp. lavendulae]